MGGYCRVLRSQIRMVSELSSFACNGIPSHDTFGRVFALFLNPQEFERCFLSGQRVSGNATGGQFVIWTVRLYALLMTMQVVRLPYKWSVLGLVPTDLVLGQLRVEGESNEITAIPELTKSTLFTGLYCYDRRNRNPKGDCCRDT